MITLSESPAAGGTLDEFLTEAAPAAPKGPAGRLATLDDARRVRAPEGAFAGTPPLSPAASRAWPVFPECQSFVEDMILNLPFGAEGLVVVAHAEPGAHLKPSSAFLTQCLMACGLGVLQVQLVTMRKDRGLCGRHGAGAGTLAQRFGDAVNWADQQPRLKTLAKGCLGFGAGGTLALVAAAGLTAAIGALVVVDGRPELAGDRLANIRASTLFVQSSAEEADRRATEIAFSRIRSPKRMEVISGAAAGEPFETTVVLIARWFRDHLIPRPAPECAASKAHV